MHITVSFSFIFLGRVCQYEMQVNNGTSLTQDHQFDSTSVVACRQQCEMIQSCQAFTFASGTCKLYYRVPSGSDITSVDGSILNIRRCIDPVGEIFIFYGYVLVYGNKYMIWYFAEVLDCKPGIKKFC